MVERSPSPLITPLLLNINQQYKTNISSNYETIQILGYGSFGVVTKVKEKSTQQLFAMKTIVFNTENEEAMQNGLKEIGILSRCDHPNIIKFHGFEINDNEINFLMDLMDSNLEVFLREKADLVTNKFIIESFFSLLDALNYLNQKYNIMHRDIKPSNILVNHNLEIKLSDFGTVKGRNRGTITEKIVGSKYFLAPELFIAMKTNINFEATVNFSKCDVFSLGLTLLRMITNEDFVKNDIVLNYNEADLENYLFKNRNKIPMEIYDTLLLMLRFNVDLRPDIITLYKIVNLRKECILNEINKVFFANFYFDQHFLY